MHVRRIIVSGPNQGGGALLLLMRKDIHQHPGQGGGPQLEGNSRGAKNLD